MDPSSCSGPVCGVSLASTWGALPSTLCCQASGSHSPHPGHLSSPAPAHLSPRKSGAAHQCLHPRLMGLPAAAQGRFSENREGSGAQGTSHLLSKGPAAGSCRPSHGPQEEVCSVSPGRVLK